MAPLMTKVMVYVMIRIMITVFTVGFHVLRAHRLAATSIVWLSVVAIVAGSLLALARTDIKKMFTYLIVAEVGYMVGGAWLANAGGDGGGESITFLSDAAMTFCLFLAASHRRLAHRRTPA